MTLSATDQRTHFASDCTPALDGATLTLAGWVHRRRDLGGLCFVELRDASGLVQVVFGPDIDASAATAASGVRDESVVLIRGTVQTRPTGQENNQWASGGVEILGQGLVVLNQAEPLPVSVSTDGHENQELLFRYRYLQLRRADMRRNMILRHQIMQDTRQFFFDLGFHELETPILCKGTPEGSREYLVPYRQEPGMFYVLPQSPQQFKQLLVTAGFERYFQIARCFRDEDLRSNRQPEFTQLDLEWAFPTQEEILNTVEGWIASLFLKYTGQALCRPFPRMPYAQAMAQYGVDKPDLRYGSLIESLNEAFATTEIPFFRGTLDKGGSLLGISLPLGGKTFSRAESDHWNEVAKQAGASGMAYVVREAEGLKSPMSKFFSDTETQWFSDKLAVGEVMLILVHPEPHASEIMGRFRLESLARYEVKPTRPFAPLFVVDFPLFEKNNDGSISAVHHPFTRPHMDQWNALIEELGHEPTLADGEPLLRLGSVTHDLVINGEEISSGSIRIHEPALQWQIFRCLGIPEETIQARFGHMLEAFRYGAPPHGGMAPGMDRLIAMLVGEEAITAVIAFPKTLKGHDLLMGAPASMPESTLTDVGIKALLPEASKA